MPIDFVLKVAPRFEQKEKKSLCFFYFSIDGCISQTRANSSITAFENASMNGSLTLWATLRQSTQPIKSDKNKNGAKNVY
jgi:hypothetical protein